MSLRPDIVELLARARADLRMGVPVVFLSEDGSGHLVAAAETLTQHRLVSFRREADRAADPSPLVAAVTNWRASTLKAHAYHGDLAQLSVPGDADVAWLHSIADPADDLSAPLKGPFRSLREGDGRAHRAAVRLAKTAQLLPAALLLKLESPARFAADNVLTALELPAAETSLFEFSPLHQVVQARLPLEAHESARLHLFRPEDGSEEHYAVEIGSPARDEPVLSRLHSACFTGDLLGSLKCDCGPQLRGALDQMGQEGAGILLYLNQEGRGIGLANKMRAYSLQDQGFDTVEANHRLGFEDDERDFRIGTAILKALGFSAVRLMTNNPAKVRMMEAQGIAVTERVPLKRGLNLHNRDYLSTKAEKSGHLL